MITQNEVIIRLLLAILLGAVIGVERERWKKAAGLRTHMLVCIGAALITLTSINAFIGADPARVAAGIITGIGFLGAGTIIAARGKVKGLTTAASLWVVAGVGLAIGAGFYLGAIVTAILVFIVLELGKFERAKQKRFK